MSLFVSRQTPTTLLVLALLTSQSYGFTTTSTYHRHTSIASLSSSVLPPSLSRQHAVLTSKRTSSLRMPPLAATSSEESRDIDDEVERLKSMAAKLRAEAASLEADQAKEMAAAAERAFEKFDTNKDGSISVEELKAGLEKAFKLELSDKRVQQLMDDFDKSGDGALQLDEFVGVEQFRNKLDALARDERAMALEKAKQAAQEKQIAEALESQLEMINDKPPTGTDRVLSTLPYLFPLLDGLQFARFLVMENPDNILAAVATILYGLYRLIPFGGFIAFFALNILSGNTRINRQIRFNMQQAIYLDIALFFPGLIAALLGLIGGGGASSLFSPAATALGTDVVFGVLMVILTYCVVSSLLGITPDKLPLISDAVSSRMPSVDNIQVVFMDKEGEEQKRITVKKNKIEYDDDDDKKKDEDSKA